MAANRATKSGINVDTKKRLEANYSIEDEEKARKWMEDIVGEEIGEQFYKGLKDGSFLCKLINKLQPGGISAKHEKNVEQNFKQIENISLFLTACKQFGMGEKDLFVTLDLHEEQNINMVLATIFALGRQAQKNGIEGPLLGPKEAEAQRREFDEQLLREGRNVASLQMGTNKVAHQAGMTPYGLGRQMYDTHNN